MSAVIDRLAQQPALSAALSEAVESVQRSVVLVRGTHHSAGSGVIWDAQGTVVSNHHVVPGPGAEVVAPGRDPVRFRVTRRSETLDLVAMVPEVAEPGDWQGPALRDSAGLRAGELVLAVGNPLGERNAATLGVLVAPPSPEDGPLRAAITLRPGNSGGAMADAEGRVVGVPHLAMRGGLGQAVSSRAVQAFLNHDTAAGPPLGISGHWIEVPEGMRGKVPATIGAGLLIAEVTAGSRAQRAGLLLGDLLVGYGGPGHDDLRPLQPSQDGVAALTGAHRLAVLRAGRLHWIEVEHPA